MLLKDRNGIYRGKAKIKNFLSFDIDIEAIINENGNIEVTTFAPIVGKISHSISLDANYDKEEYSMQFGNDIFEIKFNSNDSINIELPENIKGSVIVTRNVVLYRISIEES
ncbi:hypothetical protein [Brachyspira sp.]|uniref:hypothetical protein n=1 Tax=Brachyspira sp. TaxID=1977261 RepID=UPI00263136BF|nr:hypothetical protein [Brachyspira sp.]